MAWVLQIVFIAASIAVYRLALVSLDLRALFKRPELRQQVGVCVLMLIFLWTLKTGIQPGLDVHFLGLTAVTLMLGWRLCIVVAPIALLSLTIFGVYPWHDFGVNLFLGMIVPICFTYMVFLLTYSYLSRHLFVYIFIAGFFNAALTIAAQMFSFSVYYKLVGAFPWHVVVNDYFAIVLLMLFPEGVLNGMCIAGLVMYKPTWVTTFLDRDYLHGK
ncbi:MAG TPA: energy-coupling factor ABC transporter permease [Paenalcaligenes sp.]|nr:energy-coupling factor ABC transporter permease [Paenalcaligenes sp.]